eukprot:NODE_284_length_10808_cov_1.215613.p6 type:complete len:138 gc:universal NODE_284_length_10808_cov_1.215613:10336-10749(+)
MIWILMGFAHVLGDDGLAPIHHAILNKDVIQVELLLANNDNLNLKTADIVKTTGRKRKSKHHYNAATPLHIAMGENYVPSIYLLLQKGAAIVKDGNGNEPASDVPLFSELLKDIKESKNLKASLDNTGVNLLGGYSA